MKNLWIVSAAVLLCGLSFFVGSVVAQDMGGEDKPAAGMGMGMPEWMKKTKEHEWIGKGVGEWTVASKMWMAPGAPPVAGTGELSTESMFDGKFTVSMFKSSWMGNPYEGHLLTGYDTVAKEFFSIWIDSYGPIASISRGTMVDGVLKMTGTGPDQMTGKPMKTASTMTWQGDDQYTFTMYKIVGEQQIKGFEMVYTRKK